MPSKCKSNAARTCEHDEHIIVHYKMLHNFRTRLDDVMHTHLIVLGGINVFRCQTKCRKWRAQYKPASGLAELPCYCFESLLKGSTHPDLRRHHRGRSAFRRRQPLTGDRLARSCCLLESMCFWWLSESLTLHCYICLFTRFIITEKS